MTLALRCRPEATRRLGEPGERLRHARCRQVMGTTHGTEVFALMCPEISRETAASIADFCRAP